MTELCGIVNLHKPKGCTSRDAVNQIQRLTRKSGKVKIGHAGTLDPMATGVLVVCLGPCTRLIRLIQQMPKTYAAEFHLGRTSDTDDAEGTVVERQHAKLPDHETIIHALAPMVGTVEQRPPAFSAIHVDGKRAYELARRGEQVELAARKVRIDQITVSKYAPPKLEVTVVCGSGVYIRSIARDLGESLGCGALMSALVRTGIGDFQLETSVPLDELQSMEDVRRALQPPRTAASQLPQLEADEAQLKALHHGQMISADVTTDQEYAVVDASSRLRSIAIGIPGGQLRASVNLP